jgi:hypothetical protein
MGTGGTFPGGKARPGRDADHSPPSHAEVANEELYLLSTHAPSWRVVGQLLTDSFTWYLVYFPQNTEIRCRNLVLFLRTGLSIAVNQTGDPTPVSPLIPRATRMCCAYYQPKGRAVPQYVATTLAWTGWSQRVLPTNSNSLSFSLVSLPGTNTAAHALAKMSRFALWEITKLWPKCFNGNTAILFSLLKSKVKQSRYTSWRRLGGEEV